MCCASVKFYTFSNSKYCAYLYFNLTNFDIAILDGDNCCANTRCCDSAFGIYCSACSFLNGKCKFHISIWSNGNFNLAFLSVVEGNFCWEGVFVLEYLDCASFFHFANLSLDDCFALVYCCNQTVSINCGNGIVTAGPNNFKWIFVARSYVKLQCFARFQFLCSRWSKCEQWSWFYNCNITCESFAINCSSDLCCAGRNCCYNAICNCSNCIVTAGPSNCDILLWSNCYRQCFAFANFQRFGRFANSICVVYRWWSWIRYCNHTC